MAGGGTSPVASSPTAAARFFEVRAQRVLNVFVLACAWCASVAFAVPPVMFTWHRVVRVPLTQARQEREVAGKMFFNFSNFCAEMLSVLGAKGVFDESSAGGGAVKKMRRSSSGGSRSAAGDGGGSRDDNGLVGLLDSTNVLSEDTLVRCTMYGGMKALEAFHSFSTTSSEVRIHFLGAVQPSVRGLFSHPPRRRWCDSTYCRVCLCRFRALCHVCCAWCTDIQKRRTPCCACLSTNCH